MEVIRHMVVTGGPGWQLSGQHVSSLFCHLPRTPNITHKDCVLVLIEETNVRANVFSHLSLTCFARTHQAGVPLFYNFIIPSQSGQAQILQKPQPGDRRTNCEDWEITRYNSCLRTILVDFRLNLLFHPVTINVAQQMCSCMPVEYLCRYNVTWHREWLVLSLLHF